MSDRLTAATRTLAVLIAGVLVSRAAELGIEIDEAWLTGVLVVVAGAIWHFAASELQRRFPNSRLFRLLLITGKPPTYTPPATSSPFDAPAVSPFDRPAQ